MQMINNDYICNRILTVRVAEMQCIAFLQQNTGIHWQRKWLSHGRKIYRPYNIPKLKSALQIQPNDDDDDYQEKMRKKCFAESEKSSTFATDLRNRWPNELVDVA